MIHIDPPLNVHVELTGLANPACLLRDVCQAHRDANRTAVITEELSSLQATIYGDSKLLFKLSAI